MALTIEEQLEAMEQQLAAELNSKSEKLTDLSDEVLLERHTTLKAERLEMPDTRPAQERAAVTNKVKRIEGVLKERGVEFVALPQANQPMSLEDMSNDELLAEFDSLKQEYATATAGRRSGITIRRKAMKLEVGKRLEAMRVAPATDTVQPDPEADEPKDEELVAVEATATATEVPEEAPTSSRRRRNN